MLATVPRDSSCLFFSDVVHITYNLPFLSLQLHGSWHTHRSLTARYFHSPIKKPHAYWQFVPIPPLLCPTPCFSLAEECPSSGKDCPRGCSRHLWDSLTTAITDLYLPVGKGGMRMSFIFLLGFIYLGEGEAKGENLEADSPLRAELEAGPSPRI